ncbi:hypothetical protein C806_01211 [Lachnospiraceae bacterium 3-1]|nr:hypothetical protein C806_01211 [Lachnospiraceae bacterium 3-1]
MKRKILKTMFTITVMLSLCCSLKNVAEARNENFLESQGSVLQAEKLRLLTYEEYEADLQEGTEGEQFALESEQGENKCLVDVDEKMPINMEELSEEGVINNISFISDEEGIVSYTIPESTIKPYILNSESLKDGKLTTDTQIAWLNDFSDSDGDSLANYYVGGFPLRYLLEKYSDGFITQFTNPGKYEVYYQAMDSAGELSEIIGYTFEIVPVEDYQIIEDSLNSEDDIKTYTVDIDFSKMDTATFAIVKTGRSYPKMTVRDAAGTEVGVVKSSKGWCYVDKPSANAGICTYTISVSSMKGYYTDGSTDFRIMTGDKKDTEAMISGPENAVLLDWYTGKEDNFVFLKYTPNRDECWYRFKADAKTVFTLMAYHSELRFRICDMDNLWVLFDSNEPENTDVHKDKFTSAYPFAEKARLGMTAGKEYYLVLYAASQISSLPMVEDTINVAVGLPHMLSGSTEWCYGSNRITATSTGFSNPGYVKIGDDGATVPKTAVADEVYYSGVRPSELDSFRVMAPDTGIWRNSERYGISVSMGYKIDSTSNTNINGEWQVSFKAGVATPSISFIPALRVSYYYEIGD